MTSNISSNITLVINTQGPFTFNINLHAASLGSLTDEAVTFTVNTGSTPETRPKQTLPLRPMRGSSRRFLVTPQNFGRDSDEIVPETTDDMLPVASTVRPRKKVKLQHFGSQEADPGNSQQSLLADASDTEGDVTDYHKNEPVATFSPNCEAPACNSFSKAEA
ncbi:hypothetical protein B0H14DRAFT_3467276 [Mycena olivaceomarginata]|nr:hypothetical protein B0H14DRAFT_3467276 [Mycena olivaceomarginata]